MKTMHQKKNEDYSRQQVQTIKDIVQKVIEWQKKETDDDCAIRDGLIAHARLLARASGPGYWLEYADITDDLKLEWSNSGWFASEAKAIEYMEKYHEDFFGERVYRVVSDHQTIAERMDY